MDNEESDALFNGVSRVSPSVGENWELMAATLLVKKLAKLSAVREMGGGCGGG